MTYSGFVPYKTRFQQNPVGLSVENVLSVNEEGLGWQGEGEAGMQERHAAWQLVAQEFEGVISRAVACEYVVYVCHANVASDCLNVLVR